MAYNLRNTKEKAIEEKKEEEEEKEEEEDKEKEDEPKEQNVFNLDELLSELKNIENSDEKSDKSKVICINQ